MTTVPLLPNLAGFSVIVIAAVLICVFFARRHGLRAGARFFPAVILIAVFVVITHLPWPGPDWDGCGGRRGRLLLTPFRFIDAIGRRISQGAPLDEWVMEITVSATALNLHACLVIGAVLALCVHKWGTAALIGLVMTLLVETSQLTGLFGLAPCAWRNFEVDDLILNAAGVIIGFAIARFAGVRPLTGAKRPHRAGKG